MANSELTNKLKQKKMDALVAKNIHSKRIVWLQRWSWVVDAFALIVPILYFAPRLIAKGEAWQKPVEIIWEILAVILLALTVLKVIRKWQDRAETHTRLMGEDIGFIAQVNYLSSLYERGALPDEAIHSFLFSVNQDRADMEALGKITDSERRTAYREGLKEVDPTDPNTTCPGCGASPWNYKPGKCQMCGNTPAKEKDDGSRH